MLLKSLLVVSLLLVIAVAAALVWGSSRWKAGTHELRQQLEAGRATVVPGTVDLAELDGLPAAVQRYFRTVLKQGQPMLAAVDVEHQGSFNLSQTGSDWKPFTSTQRVVTRRPGFDWDARIRVMPGLTVKVHDAYVGGEGILHASLAGLFTVAELRGRGEIAEGELMRFLAEAAWYPTALLPSQGVRWEGVDERSARATFSDGALTLSLLFSFGDDGLIERIAAQSRGRTVGGKVVATPWQARMWNYVERDGMLIPLEGDVAWLLPQGPLPYWRGRITRIDYEFAP
jgi:hypothetical protein